MTTSSTPAESRFGIRAILGLHQPDDRTDWAAIRSTQVLAARKLALFMLAANLMCGAIAALALAEGASHRLQPWMLACWGALTGAVAATVAFRRLRAQPGDRASAGDVRDTVLEGVALAAVWSIAPLALAPHTTMAGRFSLWIVLAMLMAAAATAMAALPLATVAFIGVTGTAGAVMLLVSGFPPLAAGTLVFTLLMSMLCVGRGRSLMTVQAREMALAERDATVGMLLRDTTDDVGDWLWEVDEQRRIVRASSRLAALIGTEPDAINGMPFVQVLAGPSWHGGDIAPGLRTLADKLKARAAFDDVVVPVTVAGVVRWWQVGARPRTDDTGAFAGFRGVGSDVTDQREIRERLDRLTRVDALTGLANRHVVTETLATLLAEGEQWSRRSGLMVIALDRLDMAVDVAGPAAGDQVIARAGERLRQLVGQGCMAGRLGGDRFAVLLRDGTDMGRIDRLARTIATTLAAPYPIGTASFHVGISIGIAIAPHDARDADALLRAAGHATGLARRGGGGVVQHSARIEAELRDAHAIETALHGAIERGELSIVYQPLLSSKTAGVTGFEALLRWQHPQLGLVPPARFLPVAAGIGMARTIGAWVLRDACMEAARWPDGIGLTVNIAPEQIVDPTFADEVTALLAECALAPARLELDIPGAAFDREQAGRSLTALAALGVRIALDGVGTMPLSALSRTVPHSIKIDREFVRDSTRDGGSAAAGVAALAGVLGIATTAKGVESEDELAAMLALDCTRLQGYYFGRPLPVAEARALAGKTMAEAIAA